MGGSVRVESEVGRGSEFMTEFLAPRLSSSLPTSDARSSGSRLASYVQIDQGSTSVTQEGHRSKVLIVEDNGELARYISAVLADMANVRTVTNGLAALETADAWGPDLILTDVMMPEMDGFELCRRLKQDGRLSEIPIVMLTALTHREAMMKGWECGADYYLFKPFHPAELTARVRSLLAMVDARKDASDQRRRRKELEDFSYLASHDLKEPLRTIKMYTRAIQKKIGGGEGFEITESAAFILRPPSPTLLSRFRNRRRSF
jgi:PleD family two-component response regulator